MEFQSLLSQENFKALGSGISRLPAPTAQQEALLSVLIPLSQPGAERFDLIHRLNTEIQDTVVAKYNSLFGAATFEALNGNLHKADEFFLEGIQKVSKAIDLALPIAPIAVPLLIHSAYMDPDLALKLRISASWDESVPSSVVVSSEIDQIFLVSCNGLYFDRFAEKYAESISKLTGRNHVHFQIIQPTSESESVFSHLAQSSSLSFSRSTEDGKMFPVYLICRRFQIAYELIKRFKKPIFITDIDISLNPNASELLAARDYDIALFEFKNVAPMLICHCSIVLMQPTKNTENFLKLYSLYISKKLEEESRIWALDQCAMFVLSRLAIEGRLDGIRDFKWRNLTEFTKRSVDLFQTEQASVQEKQALRQKQWANFGNPEILVISDEVFSRRMRGKFVSPLSL